MARRRQRQADRPKPVGPCRPLWRAAGLALCGLREIRQGGCHLVGAAEDDADALVQAGGDDVEDPLAAVDGRSAGLLDDHPDRVGLVHQPQLTRPIRLPGIPGVEEDAAPGQDALDIGHHRAGPAHVVVGAERTVPAGDAVLDIAPDGRRPVALVGHVDGELAVARGDHDVAPRQHPGADLAVQREAEHALAEGQDQAGLGAIDRIARRDLAVSGLEEVLLGDDALRDVFRRGEHREDRADAEIDVDVAGAVDGIIDEQVFALGIAVRDEVDGLHLLRGQRGEIAAPFIGVEQDLVGDHVELLLDLALHVLAAEAAEHAAELALVHRMADRLAGARHDLDQQAQLRRQVAALPLLLDEETAQGDAAGRAHGKPVWAIVGGRQRTRPDVLAGVNAKWR